MVTAPPGNLMTLNTNIFTLVTPTLICSLRLSSMYIKTKHNKTKSHYLSTLFALLEQKDFPYSHPKHQMPIPHDTGLPGSAYNNASAYTVLINFVFKGAKEYSFLLVSLVSVNRYIMYRFSFFRLCCTWVNISCRPRAIIGPIMALAVGWFITENI